MDSYSAAAVRKETELAAHLSALPAVVVAYSGGVDSTYLAEVAHRALGPRSLAVTAVSPSLAAAEARAARSLAKDRGWNHREVRTHEMARTEYTANRADRCYWCKTELLEVLGPIARSVEGPVALGTNTDDLGDYRPGLRAARENDALAPLVEVGLS